MKPIAVFPISIASVLLVAAAASPPRVEDVSDKCAVALNAASPLRARVGAPSTNILDAFKRSGAKDVGPHNLTDAEWKTVDSAIAALPRLHRDVLQRHLRRISFVDASSGAGNALTSVAEPACGEGVFDLTLRAGLLAESLSDFLSGKETGLFTDDGSGTTVRIEAGAMPAAPYILLHESTHIVDGVLGLSRRTDVAFRRNLWDAARSRALASRLADNPVNTIAWRGGAKLPIGNAAELYRGLYRTPFVSLYASVAPSEDLAELVAWQQLSARWHVPPRIVVRGADGATAFAYKPLEVPAVRARMAGVAALLAASNGS